MTGARVPPAFRWREPDERVDFSSSGRHEKVARWGRGRDAGRLKVWEGSSADLRGGRPVYTISAHDCWMPGMYESEVAAYWALSFGDESLERLQAAANAREGDARHVVTRTDLEAERERLSALARGGSGEAGEERSER